jgi:hypothetical protein
MCCYTDLFRVVLDFSGGGGVPDTTRWGAHAPVPHGRPAPDDEYLIKMRYFYSS